MEVRDGDVVVAALDGDMTVKRVRRGEEALWLVAIGDERVSLEALVDAADRLMYQAKTRGKAHALIEHYRLFPQRDESEAG